MPRVTIDEIEDEDCGTLCPEHGEIEELKDEDESNMEEELNCISSIVIRQARARPPMPTSPTLKMYRNALIVWIYSKCAGEFLLFYLNKGEEC